MEHGCQNHQKIPNFSVHADCFFYFFKLAGELLPLLHPISCSHLTSSKPILFAGRYPKSCHLLVGYDNSVRVWQANYYGTYTTLKDWTLRREQFKRSVPGNSCDYKFLFLKVKNLPTHETGFGVGLLIPFVMMMKFLYIKFPFSSVVRYWKNLQIQFACCKIKMFVKFCNIIKIWRKERGFDNHMVVDMPSC